VALDPAGAFSCRDIARNHQGAIRLMRTKGMSWKTIARLFGFHPSSLRNAVYMTGGAPKPFLKNREADIMPMRARGMSWDEIASATGYSAHTLKMTASKYGWIKRARGE
jgi:lambda repressor-like predicted transcriptional regulator